LVKIAVKVFRVRLVTLIRQSGFILCFLAMQDLGVCCVVTCGLDRGTRWDEAHLLD
jgi:hypothetical protein